MAASGPCRGICELTLSEAPGRDGSVAVPRMPRIVAPAASVDEARALFDAGAHEIYAGFMPPEWEQDYGDGDTVSRRQGRPAHLRSLAEVIGLAALGVERGNTIALAFNAHYSAPQLPTIVNYARQWEDAGGTAVVAADPGLLLALQDYGSRLDRRLSLLANVFNPAACAFFAELGVSRIVVPRSLPPVEIRAMADANPNLAFEALVLYQKCPFIDGLCGFHHAVHLPENIPSEFTYEYARGQSAPITWSCDPHYEGHGCRLNWNHGPCAVALDPGDDFAAPACGACQLKDLARAGVSFLKLAGRGYPIDMLLHGVRFLTTAMDRLWHDFDVQSIRNAYAQAFGTRCSGAECYYAAGGGRKER